MDTNTPGSDGNKPQPTTPSKIQHSKPGIGQGGDQPSAPTPPSPTKPAAPATPKPATMEPEPVPMAEVAGPTSGAKITAFGRQEKRHEDETWSRTPNATGQGAIHVKTFHSKLTADALEYLDQVINEWLDAHPQYEVKFTSSSVGIVSGKLKEPHLICQVWV